MIGLRALALMIACGFFTTVTAPALAGPPVGRSQGAGTSAPGQSAGAAAGDVRGDKDAGGHGRDSRPLKGGRDHKDPNRVTDAKGDNTAHPPKAMRPMDGAEPRGGDTAQSNRGGKARGLDRADEVAGEHGKEGRDNAKAKQGRDNAKVKQAR